MEERKKRQLQLDDAMFRKNLAGVGMLKCGDMKVPQIHQIIDSHFHMDRLFEMAKVDTFDDVLRYGPMPSVPVFLSGGIVNICHGVPSKEALTALRGMKGLHVTFGIHPKIAHKVKPEQLFKLN